MTSFVSTIVYQISSILAVVLYALWAILFIALYIRFRFKVLLLLVISNIIGISYCLLRFLPYIGILYEQTLNLYYLLFFLMSALQLPAIVWIAVLLIKNWSGNEWQRHGAPAAPRPTNEPPPIP